MFCQVWLSWIPVALLVSSGGAVPATYSYRLPANLHNDLSPSSDYVPAGFDYADGYQAPGHSHADPASQSADNMAVDASYNPITYADWSQYRPEEHHSLPAAHYWPSNQPDYHHQETTTPSSAVSSHYAPSYLHAAPYHHTTTSTPIHQFNSTPSYPPKRPWYYYTAPTTTTPSSVHTKKPHLFFLPRFSPWLWIFF